MAHVYIMWKLPVSLSLDWQVLKYMKKCLNNRSGIKSGIDASMWIHPNSNVQWRPSERGAFRDAYFLVRIRERLSWNWMKLYINWKFMWFPDCPGSEDNLSFYVLNMICDVALYTIFQLCVESVHTWTYDNYMIRGYI